MKLTWPWQARTKADDQSGLDPFLNVRDYTGPSSPGLNSIVYATTDWIQKRLASCPLEIVDAEGVPVTGHYVQSALDQPSPTWDLMSLIEAMTQDALLSGNGYAAQVLAPRGPIGFEWLPAGRTQVIGRTRPMMYRHTNLDGSTTDYAPDEVLHIRMDPNPDKPAVGVSPLQHLLTEVLTDDEAAKYVTGLLKRRGTAWIVVSPDPAGRPPTPDQVAQLERRLNTAFQGGDAGSAVVLSAPGNVAFPSSSKTNSFSEVRATPEERITACYHVAASVVGLGTGIEQTKVGATMAEARRLSWRDGVLPLQVKFASQLTRQLLAPPFRFRFNTEDVEELAADRTADATRVISLVNAGLITYYTGQEELGYTPDDSAKVYYIAGQLIPEGEVDVTLPSEPPPEPAAQAPEPEADEEGDE